MFIEAKDDGGGKCWQLDYWSYRSCKPPVKSSPPTNQHPVFLQAGCPSCHPTNSVKALKGKNHIPWTCLPQAHLGVLQLCLWPLTAPGLVILEEDCHASHQPSDASTAKHLILSRIKYYLVPFAVKKLLLFELSNTISNTNVKNTKFQWINNSEVLAQQKYSLHAWWTVPSMSTGMMKSAL